MSKYSVLDILQYEIRDFIREFGRTPNTLYIGREEYAKFRQCINPLLSYYAYGGEHARGSGYEVYKGMRVIVLPGAGVSVCLRHVREA